jgi:hypothetical protein
MGSLGLTCDQVKINFPVGLSLSLYCHVYYYWTHFFPKHPPARCSTLLDTTRRCSMLLNAARPASHDGGKNRGVPEFF